MPTAKLMVHGMRGATDERHVERALLGQPGVLCAVADRAAACVEVDFEDDEVGLDRLVVAVESAGFTASLAG